MGEKYLDRVGCSKNFCSIKESSGDINHVHLLAHDYPNIGLCCGMDDQVLEFFAWGTQMLGLRRFKLFAQRAHRTL